MSVKRLFFGMAVFVAALFPVAAVCAEGGITLYQACAWGQNVDLYIAGSMGFDTLSCKISNQEAEITDCGFLADKGVTIRTTLLLDVSESIPQAARDVMNDYLEILIRNIDKNEQCKIVAFGEERKVLQDFTADRYDLASAVEGIGFQGEKSRVYDAVANTLPEMQPIGESPCYYRTILVTGGAEDTTSSIMKEELYLQLREMAYPIEIVAVSGKEQEAPDKELSALARISGGAYANLYPDADMDALISKLAVDRITWVRAKLPAALLDGSTRLFVLTDGKQSLQFDLKVPVLDVAAVREEAFGNPIFLYVGAGIGGMAFMAILLTVLHVLKKKGGKADEREGIRENAAGRALPNPQTVLCPTPGNRASFPVRLRNPADGQTWVPSFADIVTVGRNAECQICIVDPTVARLQCILYLVEGVPTVENKSTSNLTQLNGRLLNQPCPIKEGDTIQCGMTALTVECLPDSDSHLNRDSRFVNV